MAETDQKLPRHLGAAAAAYRAERDRRQPLSTGAPNGNGRPRSGNRPRDKGELESRRASDIKATKIVWLWPGRFARKKLGVIGGQPDEGKSLITLDMAAAVSRGREWPCGEGRAPLGNVVILSAEDDAADTLVPRLMAADADLERVEIIQMVRVYEKDTPDLPPQATGERRMFSLLDDLKLLERKIEDIGDIALIIIDPLTAYLGVKKMDSYRTSDVRGVLAPLAELATKRNVAIVSVMHFNKNSSITNAINRISDSVAFVAAARHAFVVMREPNTKQRRLFLKAKNNLAADTKGLAYGIEARLVADDIIAPNIVWETEHVTISANEALATAESGPTEKSALAEAIEFLKDKLANGPVPATEVEDHAKALMISARTLRRSRKALGVATEKPGLTEGWIWKLPAKTGDEDGQSPEGGQQR